MQTTMAMTKPCMKITVYHRFPNKQIILTSADPPLCERARAGAKCWAVRKGNCGYKGFLGICASDSALTIQSEESHVNMTSSMKRRQRVWFAYAQSSIETPSSIETLKNEGTNSTLDEHGDITAIRVNGDHAEKIDATYTFQGNESNNGSPSAAPHKAKVLLECVMESLNKLEEYLMGIDQVGELAIHAFNDPVEAHKRAEYLELQLKHVKEELFLKDQSIGMAVSEAKIVQSRLREVEAHLAVLRNAVAEEEARQSELLLLEEKFSLVNAKDLEEYVKNLENLEGTDERLSKFLAVVGQAKSALGNENLVLELLQKEAQISFETLWLTEEELKKGRLEGDQLASKSKKLMDEIAQRDFEMAQLRKEADDTRKKLEALSEALTQSGKRVEQLNSQKEMLEDQLKARDAILQDFQEESKRGMEALKLAAQIKQDLNASKARELQLSQELENQVLLVKQLQQELAENRRAVIAEKALKQMEKTMKDLTVEVNALKNGVKSRDEVIDLMKNEIDRNIVILNGAAESREAMRVMQLYIQDIEAELEEIKKFLKEKRER